MRRAIYVAMARMDQPLKGHRPVRYNGDRLLDDVHVERRGTRMLAYHVWQRAWTGPKGRARSVGFVSVLFVVALVAGLGSASETGIPTYSDLKADIETAYDASR